LVIEFFITLEDVFKLKEAKQTDIIIDDNPKNIQRAANVLKSSNLYNIFFATDGKNGIEQLSLREHALILLDINMPILNGYETADIIKADEKFANIPIIFLSANANKESIHEGFAHGGADYITKPFDEVELLHRVKTHIELFLSKERLRAQVEETQSLLEQYKIAVDSSSLVSKADTRGIITYVNRPFCEVSLYTQEELLGKSHNIVRSPHVDKAVYKELWETIKAKKIWRGVIENRAKDGNSYFVDSTVVPIIDLSGEIVEYISIRTDITSEVKLREDIIVTQKEILHTFGELGEWRSQETGEHVKRVSLFSGVLAEAYGCSKEEIDLLTMASPMHDIGKVIIPDSILLKPGKLTDEEFAQMREHTTYGYKIFHHSKQKLLQTAATISYEHHEKWDGTGYPDRKSVV
jgi:PAS domain S-box-containing protein